MVLFQDLNSRRVASRLAMAPFVPEIVGFAESSSLTVHAVMGLGRAGI